MLELKERYLQIQKILEKKDDELLEERNKIITSLNEIE